MAAPGEDGLSTICVIPECDLYQVHHGTQYLLRRGVLVVEKRENGAHTAKVDDVEFALNLELPVCKDSDRVFTIRTDLLPLRLTLPNGVTDIEVDSLTTVLKSQTAYHEGKVDLDEVRDQIKKHGPNTVSAQLSRGWTTAVTSVSAGAKTLTTSASKAVSSNVNRIMTRSRAPAEQSAGAAGVPDGDIPGAADEPAGAPEAPDAQAAVALEGTREVPQSSEPGAPAAVAAPAAPVATAAAAEPASKAGFTASLAKGASSVGQTTKAVGTKVGTNVAKGTKSVAAAAKQSWSKALAALPGKKQPASAPAANGTDTAAPAAAVAAT